MDKNVKTPLVPTRPLEYVGFFSMEIPTKEGPAFAFMAVDVFSDFIFHCGTERDDSPESILKNIYLLTEHPDFVKHIDKGFTLVLGDYEELEDRINAIIGLVKGKLIYDDSISKGALNSFQQYLYKNRR